MRVSVKEAIRNGWITPEKGGCVAPGNVTTAKSRAVRSPDDRSLIHQKTLAALARNPDRLKGHVEHFEQVGVFAHYASHQPEIYELLYAIPNAGKRSKYERGLALAEGLKSGFPDIGLDRAAGPYFGLRIEMKRPKARLSDVSDDQREWHERLQREGYFSAICFGKMDTIATIDAYLGLGTFNAGKAGLVFGCDTPWRTLPPATL